MKTNSFKKVLKNSKREKSKEQIKPKLKRTNTKQNLF